jgi:hypothetical protein
MSFKENSIGSQKYYLPFAMFQMLTVYHPRSTRAKCGKKVRELHVKMADSGVASFLQFRAGQPGATNWLGAVGKEAAVRALH